MTKRYLTKTTLSAFCLGLTFAGTQWVQADTWIGGTAKFEDPTAWTLGVVPSTGTNFKLNNDGSHCTADATTWAYLSDPDGDPETDDDLLSNATTYNGVSRALFGQTQSGTQTVSFTLDIGDDNTFGLGSSSSHNLGERQNTTTTVNIISGTLDLGGTTTLANNAAGTATLNVSGGRFKTGRGNFKVGGTATSNALASITGGIIETRGGLEIFTASTFEVQGSNPTSIGIGSVGTVDGYVNLDGTLRVMIDDGGITPIYVTDSSTAGSPTVTFAAGSLLDASFLNDTPDTVGTWTILEVENAEITDNGLAFAPSVNTDPLQWTFYIDNSGDNGKLLVSWGKEAIAPLGPTVLWGGDTDDNWDTTTVNWYDELGITQTTYVENSPVVFDAYATNDGTVNLTSSVSPNSILVDNTPFPVEDTDSFNFTGTGSITGFTGITKEGTGSLTLSNSGGSDFTGPINLSDGSIILGHATAFGDSSGDVSITGGTLDLGTFSVNKNNVTITGGIITNGTLNSNSVTVSDAATINANLAGDGATLDMTGANTLNLNGSNTYTGKTTISSGTVILGDGSALGGALSGVSATLTDGNADITVTPGTAISVGMYITGTGIPGGTRVNAYDSEAGIVTLSKNANSSSVETVELSGTTAFNAGTLDLNGQTVTEQFDALNGTIINSDTGTTAVFPNELRGNFGSPTFDGPGDIITDDIFKEGTGTRRIFKSGTGTLTLGGDEGNNRYGLTVNEGNVNLAKTVSAANAVGRFNLVMNTGAGTVTLLDSNQIHEVNDQNGIHEINAGTLDLNGFDEVIGSLSTTAGETAGIVTNSNGGDPSNLTLNGTQTTVNQVSTVNDVTFPGTISGNLNLIKGADQANTQTLSGVLSYTGNTTINLGTLELAGASTTLNDSSVVTITDGVLNLSNGLTDVVDQLWIDGIQQAAGTYGSTSSSATNTDDLHFAGTGMLSVTSDPVAPSDPYDVWSASKGLTPGVNDAPTDDPDGDGSNLYEYFFWDSDPLVAEVFGSELGSVMVNSGSVIFSHDRPIDHSDVTVIYQWTTDLNGAWTNSGASDGTSTVTFTTGTTGTPANGNADDYESVEVTGAVTAGEIPAKAFVRVTVEPVVN